METMLAEVMTELETWMTETCSRSIYSDIEVRDRLFEIYLKLCTHREEIATTP